MCRRPAAWLIDNEVFCEPHKELIIEAFGVDRFPIAGLQIPIALTRPVDVSREPFGRRKRAVMPLSGYPSGPSL
jgi:hypothetical protein